MCGHNLNIQNPFTKKQSTLSRRKQTQLKELEPSKLELILEYIKKNIKWMCLNYLNSVSKASKPQSENQVRRIP